MKSAASRSNRMRMKVSNPPANSPARQPIPQRRNHHAHEPSPHPALSPSDGERVSPQSRDRVRGLRAVHGLDARPVLEVEAPHEPERRAPARPVEEMAGNWSSRCAALQYHAGSGDQSADLGWENSLPIGWGRGEGVLALLPGFSLGWYQAVFGSTINFTTCAAAAKPNAPVTKHAVP